MSRAATLIGLAIIASVGAAYWVQALKPERRGAQTKLASGVAVRSQPTAAAKPSLVAPNSARAVSAGVAPEPHVGLILHDLKVGSKVFGWEYEGGGFWGDTTRHECCLIFFTKANATILALTQPMERDTRGAVTKEKIISSLKMSARSGEDVVHDCVAEGRLWAFALVSRSKRIARAVYTDGQRLFLEHVKVDAPENCTPHED